MDVVSLLNRVKTIYRNEGASTLVRRGVNYVAHQLFYSLLTLRGHYTLTLAGRTVQFSAPTPTAVRRNRSRFRREKRALQDFISNIRPDDVVYDIGANTGLYSLFAAAECPEGVVISFEPYTPNVELLEQDIARNDLSNVTVVDIALSDSVGTIEFAQPEEADVGYGSASIAPAGSRPTKEIPTTTGDRLIGDGELPQPNIVKIDVEGAEPLIIDGLATALSAPECRTVYCEIHEPGVEYRPSIDDFGRTAGDIEQQLEGLGFDVHMVKPRDAPEFFYKATK